MVPHQNPPKLQPHLQQMYSVFLPSHPETLVIFDSQLKFDRHINHITRTTFVHLKNTACLRPSLTVSAAETLIHAFITSRLASASYMAHHPNSSINSNTFRTPLPTCSPTPAPGNTSPLSAKNCTGSPSHTVYNSKSSCSPTNHLTTWPPPTSQTCSTTTPPPVPSDPQREISLPYPPRTKHRTWGDRAFSAAAPTLWNSLPKPIRDCTDPHTFKSLLKTHLFKLAFNL